MLPARPARCNGNGAATADTGEALSTDLLHAQINKITAVDRTPLIINYYPSVFTVNLALLA